MSRNIECKCCGTAGINGGYGWIKPCYDRWYKANMPEGGPPPPVSKEEWVRRRTGLTFSKKKLKMQKLMEIIERSRGQLHVDGAARSLGVTRRTVNRYLVELREEDLIP
jgi:hypothetical protein